MSEIEAKPTLGERLEWLVATITPGLVIAAIWVPLVIYLGPVNP